MHVKVKPSRGGFSQLLGRGAAGLKSVVTGFSLGRVKIWLVGYFVIGLTVLSVAAVGGSTYVLLQSAGEAKATWEDYKNVTAKKADALLAITAAFGDGGLVDSYRLYLLAPSDANANAARSALNGVKTAVAAYRSTGLSNSETSALGTADRLAEDYAKGLDTAKQMVADGKSTEDIERAVTIHDTFDNAVFRPLHNEVGGEQLEAGDQVSDSVGEIDRTVWRTAVIVGAIAFVTMLTLFWFIRFKLGRPMHGLERAMRGLAAGDLATVVPFTQRGDELGAMARAVAIFKTNSEDRQRLESLTAEQRLTAEASREATAREAAELGASLNEVANSVASSASELDGTAQALLTAADRGLDRCLAVSNASGEATTNVQAVASAAEQLYGSIREISRRVSDASSVSGQAAEQARSTSSTINGLSEAAQKIGDVVRLINDIASQTNLLALNATIEAARAGDAGKGFAVVASEVKSLATQTAKATEEIQAQIGAVQAETRNAVSAIGAIVTTITQVSEITTGIASAVEEQGAATQEIARNVQAAASRTGEVDGIVGDVREAAEDTRDQASHLRGAATELTGSAVSLRDRVDAFVEKVRAA
jgi:methyl-accepting chemotaxis protein